MDIEVFKKFLPAEMEKDEEFLAKKKVGDLEDNLDAAYHEGFCDGFNQCLENISKNIKNIEKETEKAETEKYLLKIDILQKRVCQLETFINAWKDVLLTNMTEEDFKEQLKE